MYSQYKYTVLSLIMMFTFQLFMSAGYFLAANLGIYDITETFMYDSYAIILYVIHVIIISTITDGAVLQRFRDCFYLNIRIFWIDIRLHLGI
jgi:hypothetical protein